jgi:uncharacterized membrane protein
MTTLYNRLAGQSVERLAALSDGVFAVAMTLLVLDLRPPDVEAIHDETALWRALVALAPRLLIFLLSFMTLGIFWVGQQTQLNCLVRVDRDLSWIHLGVLVAVCLMPFSTSLVAEFIAMRLAVLVYWLNIVLLGAAVLGSWRYAVAAKLVRPDSPPQIGRHIQVRIFVAQGLYAFGAALCVINSYWSIGFILLVQLNYVIAPRLGILQRI